MDGSSFASGTSLSFAGKALDTEDGDLTGSLKWTSSLNGSIGSGGSFSTPLSDGAHQIIAFANYSEELEGTDIVTIIEGGGSDFTLTVHAYKVRGTQHADLAWINTTADYMEECRDGSIVATVSNDGGYSDVGGKGVGTVIYQTCEAATQPCSKEALVTWEHVVKPVFQR
jgi:hypothetical protein